MELTQILEATLSPDTQAIQMAQQQLEHAAAENLPIFLTALASELANVSKSQVSRMAAGLQLKNYLTSKDPEVRLKYQQEWLKFEEAVRQHIKMLVLATLGTENHLHRSAAQCVAHIAAVELQMGTWPDLIPTLLNNVTSPQSTEQLKEASLEAIGYICEDLDPKFLASQSNEILTAIVQGMRKEEPNNGVRLAATKALYNSLEFTKANFEKESERHFIMQVVCEATQCNYEPIQVAALQNLVKIMGLYYMYMETYMGPALFAITREAMKSPIDAVALQGIEFWSTVCDEEADLAIEAAEAADSGHPPEQTSRFYVKGAMSYLVPILMETLAKQEEFDDEDDWNPCKAAGVCLSLMASCCEDAIIPMVMEFVMKHIYDGDWKFRDAAVMALGAIMEGPSPDELQKSLSELVKPLIQLMSDGMVQVKDSAAWTIGRVCEHCPEVLLNEEYLLVLLNTLMKALEGEPRVAVNVCWAFSSLAESAHDKACDGVEEETPMTFCLSGFFEVIVEKLLATTERPDANANSLRSSAYEALMDMIKYSAKDCYSVVAATTVHIMKRLEHMLSLHSQVTGADKQHLTDIESLLCATLQSLIRKMTKEDAVTISGDVMKAMVCMLQSAGNQVGGVQEDAVMTVSVLVDVLGEVFLQYMEFFKPFLLVALQNVADVQVCTAGVGLVGDLCRNLSSNILPFCNDLMQIFIQDLSNAAADRSIKPPILSAIGDMALAIGPEFKPYLPMVLQILQQAATIKVDKDNFDMIDYGNELRDGCLEAYIGIVQGLKETNDSVLQEVALQVPTMIELIISIGKDEDRSESNLSNAIGLLGDLCTTFGSIMSQSGVVSEVNDPIFNKMLTDAKRSRMRRTKALAQWAAKELMQLQLQNPK